MASLVTTAALAVKERDETQGAGAAVPPRMGSPAMPSAAATSTFLRVLAHELRNYIAPMHNAMHLLRLKLRADPTLAPVLDIVERQLTAMAATLEAVSDADRARHGQIGLHRSSVPVQELVDRALEMLPKALATQKERVIVEVDAASGKVHVDGARIGRALANVLDNALRYASDSPVHLRVHGTADALEIVVEDAGPGIPGNLGAGILEFFAIPHEPGHGLGIGLPLAAAIVRAHGGELAVTRAAAGGTRVVMRLPRASRVDTAPTSTVQVSGETRPSDVEQTQSTRAVSRRVLLADDSAAVRTSLTELLQEMGHEVRAVPDGAEAVTMAQAWGPEFVLLDIHMPKLNGFDAARRLRALYPSSTMQLVMMSGDGLDEAMRRGARQAGFDHCVDKGLAIGELAGLLAAGGG
ncbi:MAG: hybrid sensor histidine kinase/response regulator [Pseudomonadota bacterium]|nr:hybrid sensor histidine kinase/response regulator [Pseudomonadota bacterium]